MHFKIIIHDPCLHPHIPPGPRFAQLLCIIRINRQDGARHKPSLQQVHTVVPHRIKASPSQAVCWLLRVNASFEQYLSSVDIANTCTRCHILNQ